MAIIIRGSNVAGGVNATSENYLAVTADMSATAWKSIASHEVFTVTGLVRVRLWAEITESVTGETSTIELGDEVATNSMIATTNSTSMTAGNIWYDATPTTKTDTSDAVIIDRVINGSDIGYEIKTAATTDGTIVFHCVWEPLNASGNVAPGTGVSLT